MTTKRVFLDLGTHYGQGLNEFIARFKMDETWEIHTFEANPFTFQIFCERHHHRTPWVKPHNQAISDHDGTITVNIETPPGEGQTGMGTSVIDLAEWNPWGGQLREHFQTQSVVPCIDLSAFILTHYQPTDELTIKMDIEGSEYATLEKMIETGAIDYVNFLAVEWHSRFFVHKTDTEQRERRLIEAIQSRNITLESWK